MRKGATIIASLFFAMGLSAQQTSMPTNYWTEYESNYELYDSWWEVDDQTTNVQGLRGLTPGNGLIMEPDAAYKITSEGADNEIIHINYVKTKDYEKFGLSWLNWAYSACSNDNWQLVNPLTGENWAEGENCHRTAKGYSVDFSDPANRIVSFKYQLKSDDIVKLRVDLWDIKGRKTTKSGYICTDELEKVSIVSVTNEKQWQDFTIIYTDEFNEAAYSELEEEFDNGYFYGTTPGPLADGNNSWWNGLQLTTPQSSLSLLLDSTRIIGLEMYINCDVTTKGQEADLYIKDLTVGNVLTRNTEPGAIVDYVATAIETLDSNGELELVNGVVYSAGKIVVLDMLGQKVKSAKEQLDINDLPAGIYFIQAEEGTAKIVK